jgi:hypothetical protein
VSQGGSRGGPLQLGVSRGSPETVLRGAESFGYRLADGETDAEAVRRKTKQFLAAISDTVVARTDPARTGVSGGLTVQPQSPGLAERLWWGSGTRATGQWAAKLGLNLQSSTLLSKDTGVPFAADICHPEVVGQGTTGQTRAAPPLCHGYYQRGRRGDRALAPVQVVRQRPRRPFG